jgi:Domain of unknown function (DUF397)
MDISAEKAYMRLFAMRSKHIGWHKSSYCAAGECAELGVRDGAVLIRSSLAPRKVVRFTQDEFRALQLGFENHEFDDFLSK